MGKKVIIRDEGRRGISISQTVKIPQMTISLPQKEAEFLYYFLRNKFKIWRKKK